MTSKRTWKIACIAETHEGSPAPFDLTEIRKRSAKPPGSFDDAGRVTR